MTPKAIRERRIELGLSVEELASELQITSGELTRIESGESRIYLTEPFIAAFERLEERALATCVGAPLFV